MGNISGKSTRGGRDYQEDYFSSVQQDDTDPRSDILIVMADGMGGHAAGDVASKTAVRAFEASFLSSTSRSPTHRLVNALQAADRAIADRVSEDGALSGMGCTLIGVLKLHNRVSWISVGDSHLFLYRDGRLRKVNADHSMMGELMQLVEKGDMAIEEARAHPRRNALRSALVGKTIPLIDERSVSLVEGDILILATDGVDTIPVGELQDIVVANKSRPPEVMTQAILKRVADIGKPNQDNTTVISCYHTQSSRPTWSENSRWTLGEEEESGDEKGRMLLIALLVAAFVVIGILLALVLRPAPEPEPVPLPIETKVPSAREINGSREGGETAPEGSEIEPKAKIEVETEAESGEVPEAEEPVAPESIEVVPPEEAPVDPEALTEPEAPKGEIDAVPEGTSSDATISDNR